MKIFVCVERKHNHTEQEMEGEKKNATDMMTYSGFLWSSPPRISLKRSMFEVSAYVMSVSGRWSRGW